jgi:hypothetical protein
MTSRLSERFADFDRKEFYEELVFSGMNSPPGGERACLLDLIASNEPPPKRLLARLRLRWLTPPRLPLPSLTWA